MKSKKLLVIGVVVLALMGFVLIKFLFFSGKFLYAGTIEATKIDIPSRVSSVVASRESNEGDKVLQGQVLMQLACEDYKLAARIAQSNYDRAARLYRQGSEAKEAYDQIRHRKQEGDLKLAWCKVTAPLAGTILNTYHEVGEMVTPGSRLFTMANLQNIYAYIYVPQNLIGKLELGQNLLGLLPELGNREFQGKITHINEEAEFTPKNVQTREERTRLVFGVKISFENRDGILKPGMSIEVEIPEDKK